MTNELKRDPQDPYTSGQMNAEEIQESLRAGGTFNPSAPEPNEMVEFMKTDEFMQLHPKGSKSHEYWRGYMSRWD